MLSSYFGLIGCFIYKATQGVTGHLSGKRGLEVTWTIFYFEFVIINYFVCESQSLLVSSP